MGAFDDLIPQVKQGESGGAFEDLVPGKADAPVRFMEEPSAIEKFIGGVKLPDWMENIRGTAPARVLQGMADPMIGGTQLIANALGLGDVVNKRVAELEGDYERQRKARGSDGIDAARLVGNVVSPVNAIPAGRVAAATTTAGRAVQGAVLGGGTAALEPVADTSGAGGYWGQKGVQVGSGVAAGGVLTPILGKVGEVAVRRLIAQPTAVNPATIQASIDDALRDLGQTVHDIPPAQLQALRDQVTAALRGGDNIDAAAALRKGDFDALGMRHTAGQITRDPMQYARERDLRGIGGVGENLSAVFQEQGQALQSRLNGPAAGAKEGYQAGSQIIESLSGLDDKLRRHVTGLYQEARSSAGKDLDVPLEGLAQDYARVLGDFGDKVPAAIRAKFAALGLDPSVPSNQRQVFNFEAADSLLKNINQHVGADPVTNTALGQIRQALRSAVEAADSSGGPFAPAVKAARERFKMHDAIPALKAAAEGSVAPDDFVRRYVVGGKVDDVRGMAGVLKASDPAAFQEARAQIADTLRLAAFGQNAAGDAPFSPSRYMAQLRRLGTDKLAAFFDAKEIEDLMRVGRVGAYIHQAPNASAPNHSNTMAAIANALQRVPGAGGVVSVGNKVASTVKDGATVRNALAAEVPRSRAPLTADQENFLRYIILSGGLGAGTLAGGSVGR